jgi:type I restriction enzyme S subunit
MRTGAVKLHDVLQVNYRADANYHLSEGRTVKRYIAHSPYPLTTIGEVSKRIFYGNRARRVYVSDKEHGIPFLSSSDILQADLDHVKLASKKYTPDVEDMVLQKGWILISRSGTVGNCAFASRLHAQKLASEHVIRLVPDYMLRPGLIYAYLASKYGHSLLTQGVFGAVIQHIEPAFIASLPIPKFPESFQTEVDNLIQESARLREEANDKLEEAHKKILSIIPHENIQPSNSISIKKIESSHNKRFDATYYNSKNRALYDYITTKKSFTTLGNLAEDIFRPGIFKREYVNNGVTFLGGADILRAVPSSDKKLSFRQVKKMPELIAKKGWILVTCGGTIGNTVYVDSQLEKCAISQHVMRIVPKESTLSGYLYAVLSSELGNKLINMFAFGSVIPQVEPHHLKHVPIPLFSEEEMASIDNQVKIYVSDIEMAKEKETRAIKMVEDEIEKWNKSN